MPLVNYYNGRIIMCWKKNVIGGVLFLVVLGFVAIACAKDMKIAVAVDIPGQGATISKVGARANYFLFYDVKGNFLEAIKNPNTNVTGGVGRITADLLNKNDVTVFVSEKIGEKMQNGLKMYNIKYIDQTGGADEVVKSIIQNQ